jgi:polyisoprenoid-binding protein YceI
MKHRFAWVGILSFTVVVGANRGAVMVQAQNPAAPAGPFKIELGEGTTARYVVPEQLVGVSFGNEAVGTTTGITGTIALRADNSIDAAQSKITVDLRTLKSDQQMRDGYIQRNTLETQKFPLLEFVAKRAVGLPSPFPSAARPVAIGFQLVGDMTMHGVTREVTWSVVATASAEAVSGRAKTTVQFSTFNLTKPSVPLLLSVEDKITLEVEFRGKRTPI